MIDKLKPCQLQIIETALLRQDFYIEIKVDSVEQVVRGINKSQSFRLINN